MTVGEAELYKDNSIRSKLGLESFGDMLPKRISGLRICKLCNRPSGLRYSACRMSYCSRLCQTRDWKRHVFVCWVKGRPNEVDRLKLVVGRWNLASKDGNYQSKLLLAMFSDDNLCKTFGFNNCVEKHEVVNLICIYRNLVRSLGSVRLQHLVDRNILGEFIQSWISASQSHGSDGDGNCSCFPWFLSRCLTGFDIPNYDGDYAYQVCARADFERHFSLGSKDAPSAVLSDPEKSVASLYSILLRDFNNIPDAYTPEWYEFGFCSCTSIAQREALAAIYLKLAENGTPLDQIANSWETSTLQHLMESQGIDISLFKSTRIHFRQPTADEFGIYRLMGEVKHALSGCYCPCFKSACQFRSKYETFLSTESEEDYGFHGANTWERWQLLNFYSHVFAYRDFDARKMQEAKRNTLNSKALDKYLDSLVPDFRRKIGNIYLADGMFPKLRTGVTFSYDRPLCNCIIHRTMTSEGLDLRAFMRIPPMRGNLKEGERE